MNFEAVIREIESLGLNLYDFALYTPQGTHFHRFQPCSNCLNSYSIAKAFVVTALGMLYDEDRLAPEDPIGKYLPIPQGADPRWHEATLEHAITHTLGFDEGFLDIDSEDATLYGTEDFLSIVFSHPLAHPPGTHEQYSDAAYYLLSRVVSSAAGENLDTYLNRRLIRPLRFREIAWSRCPYEYPIGATGLYIGAQDMVKLGALYLQDGVWQNQRLLSSSWVNLVIQKGYEFTPIKETSLLGKGGMYGQLVAFSKEKDYAVAYHAHETGEGRKHLPKYLDRLIASL